MKQYQTLVHSILEDGERETNRTGIDTIRVSGAMMKFDLRDGFPAQTTKKLAFKSVIGELCAFLRAQRSAADFRALGSKVWDQNANENKQWLENPFRKGQDDLGPVYGVQWREWEGFKVLDHGSADASDEEHDRQEAVLAKMKSEGWVHIGYAEVGPDNTPKGSLYYKAIDQLGNCVRTIIKNPSDRRILFHGWNPAVLDEVALPACHLLYQFIPTSSGYLDMILYLR